jgi:hypothetical protein
MPERLHGKDPIKEILGYFDKLRRGVKFAWIFIGIACLLGGTAIFLAQVYNNRALHKIQNQRRFICLDQNERHDNAIKELRNAIKIYVEKYPKQAQMAKASIRTNIRIVNAVIPKRDCVGLTKLPL